MLRIQDLVVRYGQIAALRGVSLEVYSNDVVAIIGPNGAGKSTLLLSIAGAMTPSEGDILFQGRSIRNETPEARVRRGIALVPEGRHVFPRLSVSENLQIPGSIRQDARSYRHDLDRVYSLFPVLKRYAGAPAGQLSGGEQQQLAIGRALLTGARLLLLDEPSLGLAPLLCDTIFSTFAQLQEEGYTLVIVEQAVERALQLADRAYVLRTGRIEASGLATDLLADKDFQSNYLGL